jgi:hypothetical protein
VADHDELGLPGLVDHGRRRITRGHHDVDGQVRVGVDHPAEDRLHGRVRPRRRRAGHVTIERRHARADQPQRQSARRRLGRGDVDRECAPSR